MTQAFRVAISRLPQIIEKNAPGMMTRMIARMKADLAHVEVGDQNVSHGALFLKVAEEDLVRNFVTSTHAAFLQEDSALVGLSLEPEGGKAQDAVYTGSLAAYDKLCASAQRLGVSGLERFGKDPFERAMEDAFKRSRMDERATDELMGFARAALNAELLAIYTKLDDLASQPAA
ncbi:MAG TPA: hypothetical protein VIE63_07545 [Ramlibacter sp.]|jgi:hypothetical protein